ncbi:hypothetical protein [Methylobacterium mesophilicum]|uniref:hypothetical protein n=1 Tax=Methylobacterium mesophilicum TaxID=39956 RepID=UPI002F34F3DE
MTLARKRLEVGQDYCSDDGKIDGVIVKVWPLERGSEALVKLRGTADIVRVFIAGEGRPVRR